MTLQETGDHVVKEINKYVGLIRTAKSEQYDGFAKEKIRVLVEVLDLLDEVKDEAELATQIQQLYKSHTGALDGLRDLMQTLNIKA